LPPAITPLIFAITLRLYFRQILFSFDDNITPLLPILIFSAFMPLFSPLFFQFCHFLSLYAAPPLSFTAFADYFRLH